MPLGFIRNREGAENTRAQIEKSGGEAITIQADVRPALEIRRMMQETYDRFGLIDILVNNAGSMVERVSLLTISEERWDEVLDVKFRLLLRLSPWDLNSSNRPCSAVSQSPSRTPIRRTPLTRRMPAASSGLSNPESAASYATRLTAANRRLIVVGARCRCSKWIRYRRTTVRLKARRGSEQYQSTNSFIA